MTRDVAEKKSRVLRRSTDLLELLLDLRCSVFLAPVSGTSVESIHLPVEHAEVMASARRVVAAEFDLEAKVGRGQGQYGRTLVGVERQLRLSLRCIDALDVLFPLSLAQPR